MYGVLDHVLVAVVRSPTSTHGGLLLHMSHVVCDGVCVCVCVCVWHNRELRKNG